MTMLQPAIPSFPGLTDFYSHKHSQLEKYLFWQVHSVEIAEELAQETYARYLRQPQQTGIANLNALLFTIAKNLAFDHLRAVRRRNRFEFIPYDEEIPDTGADLEATIVENELFERLAQAVANLPDKTREIFLLYRLDDLSYRDIAQRLDITERTVEYHLRRAITHCRQALCAESVNYG